MDSRRPLLNRLVDLEHRRRGAVAAAKTIADTADKMERRAAADMKKTAEKLESASGAERWILELEAEYLDAVDRRRRAVQAGAMARATLKKLGDGSRKHSGRMQ